MPLREGIAFLSQLDSSALLVMFWHTFLLEMPRYVIAGTFVAVTTITSHRRRSSSAPLSVSVLLPAHNEAANLPRAVRSIREQTIGRCQIVIVDDGSGDATAAVARRLKHEGAVDVVVSTHVRAGKSAAANLGFDTARARRSSSPTPTRPTTATRSRSCCGRSPTRGWGRCQAISACAMRRRTF